MGSVIYRDAALADGRSPQLRLGVSVLVQDSRISWVGAGVIAEGGPADFSLVHGDPLTDPAALWRVWRVA